MYITNIDSFKKEDLFYCYSPKLKKFLCTIKGFHYISMDKKLDKEQKTYWIFLKTDGLSDALKEWTNNKKNNIKAIV